MGVVDQTKLFWETAIEVAKSSGMDEVTGSPVQSASMRICATDACNNKCLSQTVLSKYRQGSESSGLHKF